MRVLLATDGSEDARHATAWLREFPLPPGSPVLVLSVAAFPPSPLDIPPVREYNWRLLDAARQVAEAARDQLGRRAGDAEARVMEGEPREVVARAARDWRAELVVVGARGLGGVKRFLLGSVSTGIVHRVRCPVLVVRGTARPLARTLVALDGSADALAAARFLAALPLPPSVGVRLLGVVEPLPAPHPIAELFTRGLLEERQAALEDVLGRVAPTFGDRAVERSVVVGQPAAEILAAAEEPGVDLVVLGARGKGALSRMVLGSVSERVLQHAPCPVLIVTRRRGRRQSTP